MKQFDELVLRLSISFVVAYGAEVLSQLPQASTRAVFLGVLAAFYIRDFAIRVGKAIDENVIVYDEPKTPPAK